MTVPDRRTARAFAASAFASLSSTDRGIRFRLCELVEHCVLACARDEDPTVLCAASYLQEVGVVFSSKQKAVFSLEMVRHAFAEGFEDLDPRLVDCIGNHVRAGEPGSAEASLMRICHKYATTHYLDYLLLKSRVSAGGFEKLQLERIEAYRRWLRAHPRGEEINAALQRIFLLREPLSPRVARSGWHQALRELQLRFPFNALLGARRAG